MRLYLDVCAIQRPLDDLSQLRVRLEAEAVLGVLAACAAGRAELVASDVHFIEIRRNPHPNRRDVALETLALAAETLPLSPRAASQARTFTTANLMGPDALHLAVAIEAEVDYLCTTDDRFLRRSKRVDTGGVSVVSPLDLALLLDQP